MNSHATVWSYNPCHPDAYCCGVSPVHALHRHNDPACVTSVFWYVGTTDLKSSIMDSRENSCTGHHHNQRETCNPVITPACGCRGIWCSISLPDFNNSAGTTGAWMYQPAADGTWSRVVELWSCSCWYCTKA